MRYLLLAGGLLALMMLWLPANTAAASAPPAAYEPAPCPMPAPSHVTCGYLTVPENRNQPTDHTIRLPFAIIKSRSASPAPDPILFPTGGGPGSSSLERLEQWLDSAWLDQRYLILFEQRGARYAQPTLACQEGSVAFFENFGLTLPPAAEDERIASAARTCFQRLRSEGIDLSAYNSASSAADIEDLRRALGYERWNLYGVSYGTRLVLETMRRYPDGVRSALLDSAYPPSVAAYEGRAAHAQRAFDTLVAGCAANPRCHDAYPDLEQQFSSVVARLNAEPARLTVLRPDNGQPFAMALTGDDLATGVFRLLYDARMLPVLPFVIDQLERGNMAVLEPLAQSGLSGILTDTNARGLYYAVQCHEELPFNDPEAVAADADAEPLFGRALPSGADRAVCAGWEVGMAEGEFRQPVASSISTLVLAGEYDPTTPPAWGRLAAATLSRSYFYQFPGIGHSVLGYSRCARGMAVAFLNQPEQPPDSACIEAMSGPSFITTADVVPTPAVYRLTSQPRRYLPQVVLLAVSAGLSIALLLVEGVRQATRRMGRRTDGASGDGWLPLAISVCHGLFIVALAVSLVTSPPIVLAFGLPRWMLVTLILPLMGSLLALWLLAQRLGTGRAVAYPLLLALVGPGLVGSLLAAGAG
jgi:pimeloyl-ACP methyl ester carboxylesterase